jgi:hypothetical protein
MPQNKQNRDSYLRGSPGYRTQGGRSGLDPIDTYAEAARIEGVFLVRVFKLQARTRNPFYLIAMFVFGVLPFPALAALVVKITVNIIMKPPELSSILLLLAFYLTFGVIAAFTGALSINFVLSILEVLRIIPPLRRGRVLSKKPEKKHPKRRKDYR